MERQIRDSLGKLVLGKRAQKFNGEISVRRERVLGDWRSFRPLVHRRQAGLLLLDDLWIVGREQTKRLELSRCSICLYDSDRTFIACVFIRSAPYSSSSCPLNYAAEEDVAPATSSHMEERA